MNGRDTRFLLWMELTSENGAKLLVWIEFALFKNSLK